MSNVRTSGVHLGDRGSRSNVHRSSQKRKSNEKRQSKKLSNILGDASQRAPFVLPETVPDQQKLTIIALHDMGFEDEMVERAVFYAGAKTVEEAMNYLIPNADGLWEHKFVAQATLYQGDA